MLRIPVSSSHPHVTQVAQEAVLLHVVDYEFRCAINSGNCCLNPIDVNCNANCLQLNWRVAWKYGV